MASCMHLGCRLGTRGRYEAPLFSNEVYHGGPAMNCSGLQVPSPMLPLVHGGLNNGWTDAALGPARVYNQDKIPGSVMRCFSTSQLFFSFSP